MIEGTVDLHVCVVEYEDEVETVQVRQSFMARRIYVVRASSNHALAVAFMGSYATSKVFKESFYYMRKVKVYGHTLTVWPSAMVVAAPSDENFDIGTEAQRLD